MGSVKWNLHRIPVFLPGNVKSFSEHANAFLAEGSGAVQLVNGRRWKVPQVLRNWEAAGRSPRSLWEAFGSAYTPLRMTGFLFSLSAFGAYKHEKTAQQSPITEPMKKELSP